MLVVSRRLPRIPFCGRGARGWRRCESGARAARTSPHPTFHACPLVGGVCSATTGSQPVVSDADACNAWARGRSDGGHVLAAAPPFPATPFCPSLSVGSFLGRAGRRRKAARAQPGAPSCYIPAGREVNGFCSTSVGRSFMGAAHCGAAGSVHSLSRIECSLSAVHGCSAPLSCGARARWGGACAGKRRAHSRASPRSPPRVVHESCRWKPLLNWASLAGAQFTLTLAIVSSGGNQRLDSLEAGCSVPLSRHALSLPPSPSSGGGGKRRAHSRSRSAPTYPRALALRSDSPASTVSQFRRFSSVAERGLAGM